MAIAVQGDLIYASAADTWARLAKSASATRYLTNRGASNAPTWDLINLPDGVTGALPDANLSSNVALLNRNSQTWTGTPQTFHADTDQNFDIRGDTVDLTGAVVFSAFNDAVTLNVPLEFRASVIQITFGGLRFGSTGQPTASAQAIVTGNNNNIGYGLGFIRLTGNALAAPVITGFTGGTIGQMLIVVDETTNPVAPIAYAVEDANSTAANRIAGTVNHTPGNGRAVVLFYGNDSRWHIH